MNFLELCKRVRQECGISGVGPVSVLNQSGEIQRVIDWTREAWNDIQNQQPWNWLWQVESQAIVPGSRIITPAQLGISPVRFDLDSFSIYETAVGISDEHFLTFITWDDFKRSFETNHIQTSRPSYFTIDYNKHIRFDCSALSEYTLGFKYYSTPQKLTADADIPLLPEQYHMAIVWQAVVYYATFEEAQMLLQMSQTNVNRYLQRASATETPYLEMPGPLV